MVTDLRVLPFPFAWASVLYHISHFLVSPLFFSFLFFSFYAYRHSGCMHVCALGLYNTHRGQLDPLALEFPRLLRIKLGSSERAAKALISLSSPLLTRSSLLKNHGHHLEAMKAAVFLHKCYESLTSQTSRNWMSTRKLSQPTIP